MTIEKSLEKIVDYLSWIALWLFIIAMSQCGVNRSRTETVIITPTPLPSCTGNWYKDFGGCKK